MTTNFLTEDEIFKNLIEVINDPETIDILRRDFKPRPEDDGDEGYLLVLGRIGFGRDIRNHYQLWNEENPYTNINSEANEQGYIDHLNHPDNMSDRIIDKLVKYYQEKS